MIQVSHLSFSYTTRPFIQDMSFSVAQGEIFGFLGPSGAGKSTLQKILLGLLPDYQGSARVNGAECRRHGADFYESIGVDFEFSSLYEKLSARENLRFFSSLYRRQARSIPELLAMVGLENDADKRVSDYSKGMKSRLNFVRALLHDPALLFLDEPTSGLDPTNSHLMKDMILEEKRRGKTILLTTHNMQDAAELCDRVAFIVGGRIFALLIFSDPAAMGLFFMGAIVLLEKSQRVTPFLAVSPLRAWEYVCSKVLSLSAIALAGAAAQGTVVQSSRLPVVLLGTFLSSVLFTLLGMILATRVASLNHFLLASVPVEILAFLPAALHLFGVTPARLGLYPASVCMDLIAGRTCSAVGLVLTAALTGLLYAVARSCVLNMWKDDGGVRL